MDKLITTKIIGSTEIKIKIDVIEQTDSRKNKTFYYVSVNDNVLIGTMSDSPEQSVALIQKELDEIFGNSTKLERNSLS